MSTGEGAELGSVTVDFSVFIRTGRLTPLQRPVEVKFNPYHDPQNGQFTFAPGGARVAGEPQTRFQGGGGASGDYASPDPRDVRHQSIYTVKRGDTLSSIAKRRKGLTPADLAWLNGIPENGVLRIGQRIKVPDQLSLDAGRDARNELLATAYYMATHSEQLPPPGQKIPPIEEQILGPQHWRAIESNGYEFSLDALERTRQVTGDIKLANGQARSKKAQATAGGKDRLPDDQGGHYIAVRFGGPTDAFNHFAQNGNFNQGAYRVLENEWASATKSSKKVRVGITPLYDGVSKRPYKISVAYAIDGNAENQDFWNKSRKKK